MFFHVLPHICLPCPFILCMPTSHPLTHSPVICLGQWDIDKCDISQRLGKGLCDWASHNSENLPELAHWRVRSVKPVQPPQSSKQGQLWSAVPQNWPVADACRIVLLTIVIIIKVNNVKKKKYAARNSALLNIHKLNREELCLLKVIN